MQKLDIPELEKATLKLVNEASIPVTVDYIAKTLKVSWCTARSLLLSLAAQDRVRGVKTMKSWIFEPARRQARNEPATK